VDSATERVVNPGSQKSACTFARRNLSQAEWRKYLPDEPYRKTCEQWEAGK
jgi:hypothetical protein